MYNLYVTVTNLPGVEIEGRGEVDEAERRLTNRHELQSRWIAAGSLFIFTIAGLIVRHKHTLHTEPDHVARVRGR